MTAEIETHVRFVIVTVLCNRYCIYLYEVQGLIVICNVYELYNACITAVINIIVVDKDAPKGGICFMIFLHYRMTQLLWLYTFLYE